MVIGDLARMGYDARWGIVGAHHAGAPHKRDRIWILAHSKRIDGSWAKNLESSTATTSVPSSQQSKSHSHWVEALRGQWDSEPDVGRVADGVASRLDRMRAIGNGQVPAVVPLAWNLLSPLNSQAEPPV